MWKTEYKQHKKAYKNHRGGMRAPETGKRPGGEPGRRINGMGSVTHGGTALGAETAVGLHTADGALLGGSCGDGSGFLSGGGLFSGGGGGSTAIAAASQGDGQHHSGGHQDCKNFLRHIPFLL